AILATGTPSRALFSDSLPVTQTQGKAFFCSLCLRGNFLSRQKIPSRHVIITVVRQNILLNALSYTNSQYTV
ncbi:hypothetical protein, partial [Endozoicomonas sp. ONNA2]|uniref:hypothetical protein n=1 Tax=Endozoicomonas sp. ONNA2 TaxID=2828741 RepID=UPI0021497E58